ncbi:MAG: sn-glycerol-3-phosphate ABC transporter ATP-binding protein UgpC [Aquamicrobium sp.]|nr:sn-glycerol-3-phosphate ABC transporter ATP-binding protein UgpC [Aquamicrobium sp.]
MPEIRIEGLRKTYPGNPAEVLKGIDLTVADGEMAVLVGPSGCGKSTLLRMVAGLESVTAGEISIGSRMVNRLEPADRDIAMVFQNYALYPHMTVRQNLEYGLKNRATPRAEIDARVAEAARMLEITPFLDRKPAALSGGQRQRVAMGRAVVRKPQAFLFDEPLSNLDAKLRVHMRVEIRRLQRALNVTSLYVTHDQVEAMTLADKLVVMNAGVAEQIGTPSELYARPASRFVAEFIGSPAMNMLAARATAAGGIEIGGGRVVRLAAHACAEGQEVLLGLRPEHLELARDSAPDIEIGVRAIEILGADTLAHGELVGANGHARMMVVRLPGDAQVAEGDRLPLRMQADKAHLFDAVSGLRL